MIRVQSPDFKAMGERIAALAVPRESDMATLAAHVLDTIHFRTTNENVDRYGVPFKQYSTHPIYIGGRYKNFANGGRSTRLKKRKRGRNTMKTMYFQGGYKQFKDGVGRRNSSGNGVDLTVTGDLMGAQSVSDAAFRVTDVGPSEAIIGFIRAKEQTKAAGIIDSGRDFWGFGEIPDEMTRAANVLRDSITERVNQALEAERGDSR